MARMKIVLRASVPKLGQTGDVVSVAGGYARNFLIPRGLAAPATTGNVKQAETWRQSRSAKDAKDLAGANELKTKLEASSLQIAAQAGPDGRLFGSVTTAQIAQAISARLGTDVDRHAIELSAPIRHLGLHEVRVPVHPDLAAVVTVEVTEA